MANASIIKELLGNLLQHAGLPFTNVIVSEEKDYVRIEIVSPQPSRIIGWHGETLNALQHLMKSLVRSAEGLASAPFIVLDVDGYRKSQEEKVCHMAMQKAEFVRRTGNRVALVPMSPYFRRVVHLYVANAPELSDLATESIGEGDYRQVVLRMKEEKGSAELTPVMAEAGKGDGLENLDI
jgi:spoIIIJ-associated protein